MGINSIPPNPFPPSTETMGGNAKPYELPIASTTELGGVKVGQGLTINAETGVLINNNPTQYTLPTASAETLGGVKVGSGLAINSETGVLSSNAPTYTAGNYISIDNTNKISVDKSLPYVGNSYRITSYDTSGEAKIKVTKYEGETVISETIVDHHNVSQPQVFDVRFSIQYSSNWIYKNIVASNDHPANWTKTWGFDQTVNFTERFDNSGDTLALVKQVDAIKNAIISASSFTDAQSKLAQL